MSRPTSGGFSILGSSLKKKDPTELLPSEPIETSRPVRADRPEDGRGGRGSAGGPDRRYEPRDRGMDRSWNGRSGRGGVRDREQSPIRSTPRWNEPDRKKQRLDHPADRYERRRGYR